MNPEETARKGPLQVYRDSDVSIVSGVRFVGADAWQNCCYNAEGAANGFGDDTKFGHYLFQSFTLQECLLTICQCLPVAKKGRVIPSDLNHTGAGEEAQLKVDSQEYDGLREFENAVLGTDS